MHGMHARTRGRQRGTCVEHAWFRLCNALARVHTRAPTLPAMQTAGTFVIIIVVSVVVVVVRVLTNAAAAAAAAAAAVIAIIFHIGVIQV